MKDDVISRQAAISLPVKPKEDRYFQTQNLDDAYDYGWYSLQKCIERLPPARPERPKGHWIHHQEWEACGECGYECNQCGMGSEVDYNFCMRCGADMRGEGNDSV